jgi:hypothetical protein
MIGSLLVVAKRPVPGQTKTRLCPPMTSQGAAGLYECFLRDTLEIMRHVPDVSRTIGYFPEDAHDYFLQLAPDMHLICQRGESLGERLDNLLANALSSGVSRAVVIDSDSPTLPAGYIVQAFEFLTTADVVIGPTVDGGYYLIGMNMRHPQLLRQVRMSTPQVLSDTLSLADSAGLRVALLPAWYDVDTVVDLHRLCREAGELSDGIALHTRRWLAESGWEG